MKMKDAEKVIRCVQKRAYDVNQNDMEIFDVKRLCIVDFDRREKEVDVIRIGVHIAPRYVDNVFDLPGFYRLHPYITDVERQRQIIIERLQCIGSDILQLIDLEKEYRTLAEYPVFELEITEEGNLDALP